MVEPSSPVRNGQQSRGKVSERPSCTGGVRGRGCEATNQDRVSGVIDRTVYSTVTCIVHPVLCVLSTPARSTAGDALHERVNN